MDSSAVPAIKVPSGVVAPVVTVVMPLEVPEAAGAPVCVYPNLLLDEGVVSVDPDFDMSSKAVVSVLEVARHPCLDGHPIPIAAVVIAYAYVGIHIVVGENGSDDDTAKNAADQGAAFIVRFCFRWREHDDCCE